MIAVLSPVPASSAINLGLASEVAHLYLEEQGIRNSDFRVVSVKRNACFDEIDVTIKSTLPVPASLGDRSILFIPVAFWQWAEAQIELESEIFAA